MSLSEAVRAGAAPEELAALEPPAEFLAAHLAGGPDASREAVGARGTSGRGRSAGRVA